MSGSGVSFSHMGEIWSELGLDEPGGPAARTDVQAVERALARLAPRLVGTTLTVDASEHRAQRRNRTAARERMTALLREALAPPPPSRRATKPTRGSQRRRLAAKSRRGEIKRARSRPSGDD